MKYREVVLSDGTRKLLWFEITKMLITLQFEKKILRHLL